MDAGVKQKYSERYQKILAQGDAKCPPPDKSSRIKGQRGRLKRTKSRSLLERLRDYQDDVLRFMMSTGVPFTNNQGENDIRMTKVHQKISGCFRSMQGAKMFCLIRSYLSTCRKQSVSASLAYYSKISCLIYLLKMKLNSYKIFILIYTIQTLF